LAGRTNADTRPKLAKELAYPNARQTETLQQIERQNDRKQ